MQDIWGAIEPYIPHILTIITAIIAVVAIRYQRKMYVLSLKDREKPLIVQVVRFLIAPLRNKIKSLLQPSHDGLVRASLEKKNFWFYVRTIENGGGTVVIENTVKEYTSDGNFIEELKFRFYQILEKQGLGEKFDESINGYNGSINKAKKEGEEFKKWLKNRIQVNKQIMNMRTNLTHEPETEYLEHLFRDWLMSMDEDTPDGLWYRLNKKTYEELKDSGDFKDFVGKLEKSHGSSREQLQKLDSIVNTLFNKIKAEYSLTPVESTPPQRKDRTAIVSM